MYRQEMVHGNIGRRPVVPLITIGTNLHLKPWLLTRSKSFPVSVSPCIIASRKDEGSYFSFSSKILKNECNQESVECVYKITCINISIDISLRTLFWEINIYYSKHYIHISSLDLNKIIIKNYLMTTVDLPLFLVFRRWPDREGFSTFWLIKNLKLHES